MKAGETKEWRHVDRILIESLPGVPRGAEQAQKDIEFQFLFTFSVELKSVFFISVLFLKLPHLERPCLEKADRVHEFLRRNSTQVRHERQKPLIRDCHLDTMQVSLIFRIKFTLRKVDQKKLPSSKPSF